MRLSKQVADIIAAGEGRTPLETAEKVLEALASTTDEEMVLTPEEVRQSDSVFSIAEIARMGNTNTHLAYQIGKIRRMTAEAQALKAHRIYAAREVLKVEQAKREILSDVEQVFHDWSGLREQQFEAKYKVKNVGQGDIQQLLEAVQSLQKGE